LSCGVGSGHGARWPTLGTGDWCWTTITDGSSVEIIKVTAISTDTFTIERGQQGTIAQSWSAGATIQHRLTRDTLLDLQNPKLVLATGWSASNYLNSGTGVLNGHSNMTIAVMARLARVQDGLGTWAFAGAGGQFTSGWKMTGTYNRPGVGVGDGSGSMIATDGSTPNWGPDVATSYAYADWKSVIVILRYATPSLTIMLNMIDFRTINTGGGVTAASSGARLGGHADAASYFTDGGIAGFAYADEAFSLADLRTWSRACMSAADVVQGSLNWDTRVSFKQLRLREGDSVPATVDDVVGSSDFTRTGTLSIVEEMPRWL
jgi:hypothetical protein